MTEIPVETQRQLEELIAEKRPAEEIAFMMRLDLAFVEAEIKRLEKLQKSA